MKNIIILLILVFSQQSFSKVKIGLLINESDASTSTSNSVENNIKKGFDLALSEINSKEYEFEWINIGETAQSTIKSLEIFKNKQFKYLIGASHSFQAEIISNFLKENKLNTLLVSPTGTSDNLLKNKNVFLMSNSNSIQSHILTKQINKNSKVLLINIVDCVYCKNFSDLLSNDLKKANISFIKCDVLESNFNQADNLCSAEGFNVVVIPALEKQFADLIKVYRKVYKNVLFLSGDGVGTLGRYLLGLEEKEIIQVKWLTHYHSEIKNRHNEKFVKKFKNKFGIFPIDTSAFYYESLKFVIMNFEKKNKSFDFVTGNTLIIKNQIVRDMALMSMQKGMVTYSGIVEASK